MITPFDIEKKEFSKGVRGYSIEEVDAFLDEIIVDLEKILKENLRLRTEVEALEKENDKYKGSEGELVKVLEHARDLMGDISTSAEKRADVLVRNAELEAEQTMREARYRAERLREENGALEKRYVAFRDRFKKMLEDELTHFSTMSENMESPFDDNRLEELVNAPLGGVQSRGDTSTAAGEEVKDRKTVVMDAKSFR